MKNLLTWLLTLIAFSVMVSCEDGTKIPLNERFDDMDSVYAYSEEGTSFFKGRLFDKKGESLFVYQEEQNCHFVFTELEGSIKSDSIEVGFLGAVRLIDLNSDGRNELILQSSSGNSPDDMVLVYKKEGYFLRMNFPMGSYLDVLSFENKKEYITAYSSFGCADQSWRSELLELVGDSVRTIGKIELYYCDDLERRELKIYRSELDKPDSSVFDIDVINKLHQYRNKEINTYWHEFLKKNNSASPNM